MTEEPKPSIDISGMTYEQAVKHLQKVTPWTTSMIMNYVAIVLGEADSDVITTNDNASQTA